MGLGNTITEGLGRERRDDKGEIEENRKVWCPGGQGTNMCQELNVLQRQTLLPQCKADPGFAIWRSSYGGPIWRSNVEVVIWRSNVELLVGLVGSSGCGSDFPGLRNKWEVRSDDSECR